MKNIVIISLISMMLGITQQASAQFDKYIKPNNSYGIRYNRVLSDSTTRIPFGATPTVNDKDTTTPGALYMKIASGDSSLYMFTGARWKKVIEDSTIKSGFGTKINHYIVTVDTGANKISSAAHAQYLVDSMAAALLKKPVTTGVQGDLLRKSTNDVTPTLEFFTPNYLVPSDTNGLHLIFHYPLYRIANTPHIYIDGDAPFYNAIKIYNVPVKAGMPAADGQVLTYNANFNYSEWKTPETGMSQSDADAAYLKIAGNLSDVSNPATARTNLGLTGNLTNGFGITSLNYNGTANANIKADTSSGGLATYGRGLDWYNILNAAKLNISDTASMLSHYIIGSGTASYIPKFAGSKTLASSNFYDNGTIGFYGANSTTQGSRFYIYGGTSGANVDIRGTSGNFVDQSVLELEGNDYDATPNSVFLMYRGSTYTGTDAFTGLSNTKLAVLAFNNAANSAIATTGTPVRFILNGTEVLQATSNGLKITSPTTNTSSTNIAVFNGANEIEKRTVGSFGFATLTGTETLQNKTIDNTNTITVKDAGFTVQNATTTSKQFKLDISSISASTTRTWIVPDASSIFVGTDATQTLTNKTIAAGSNTISGLTNANLSGTAGITNANLANSSVTINGNSVSLGASISLSLASSSFANQGTTTTVLHGNAAGNPSFAQIVDADVSASAAIAYSKLNLVTSIVNADISSSAAIANSKLANSTISGVSLGSNLNTLTFNTTNLTGTSYNGSANITLNTIQDIATTSNVQFGTSLFGTLANAPASNYIIAGRQSANNRPTLVLQRQTNTSPTGDFISLYDAATTPAKLFNIDITGTVTAGTWNGTSISTTYTDAKIKTVTGTTNRVSTGGTSTDPTVDISSSYVGQSSITTLGTIATGVWNGTAIGDSYISSASTWNGKQSALSGTGLLSFSGTTASYNTTSASIAGIISDETGTNKMVFSDNPTLNGVTIGDGTNVVLNTTTGTKIGTGTSQKLAFYNSTPIVQPSGNALTALQNLGLISSATLAKSDVGLGNVDNTSDATKNSATATLSNKRWTARVHSQTSVSTLTPDISAYDMEKLTAQAASLTIANPTGSPNDGDIVVVRIIDNGTARAISFGTQYRGIGITLPATTVISKYLYIYCVYNSTDTKWDVTSAQQQ